MECENNELSLPFSWYCLTRSDPSSTPYASSLKSPNSSTLPPVFLSPSHQSSFSNDDPESNPDPKPFHLPWPPLHHPWSHYPSRRRWVEEFGFVDCVSNLILKWEENQLGNRICRLGNLLNRRILRGSNRVKYYHHHGKRGISLSRDEEVGREKEKGIRTVQNRTKIQRVRR